MALLEIEHLKKYFNSSRGTVHAVDDVTFSIKEGETMGRLESPDAESLRWAVRSSTFWKVRGEPSALMGRM